MSDIHSRHAAKQGGGDYRVSPHPDAQAHIERVAAGDGGEVGAVHRYSVPLQSGVGANPAADKARSLRAVASYRGDLDAVQRYDALEREALGGAVEGAPGTENPNQEQDGAEPDAWPTVYNAFASRAERADTGEYADLILEWGRPHEAEFQQNYGLAEQLAGEVGAKYPGLDEALNTAVYQVDGEWKPLRDNAAVMRMLAHIARRLSKLQASAPATRGARAMQNGKPAASVADRIDEVRAQRRLALAEGNHRKAAELDAAERALWAQTAEGRGGVVDGMHRTF